MNAEKEFAYASYKEVYQPQYDSSSVNGDYFQHKIRSFVSHDMKKQYPNDSEEKVKILQEIYDSERAYVINLTILDEVFIPKFYNRDILPKKKLKQLFGEIFVLNQTNQMLLETLRVKSVAEAFLQLLPFLKLYSSYATNYPKSLKAYADLMSRFPFRSLLEEVENDPRSNGNKLNSLLIMPVQRIPRYILLVEKLMVHSTDPEEMHKLCKVVAEMRNLSEHMQTCMATYENGERLLYIQHSFGLNKHVFEPGRVLIKEGMLYKRSMFGSSLFEDRVFFLFNDVLLFGKKRLPMGLLAMSKYEPSAMLSLKHCDVDYNSVDELIFIRCGEEKLEITADTVEIAKEWYECIKTAVSRAKILRQTLRKESFNGKVLYFDRGFWKRCNNIRSMINGEVTSTVERVFSRKQSLPPLDDSDFLNGNWHKTRKRKSTNSSQSGIKSKKTAFSTEKGELDRKKEVLGKSVITNKLIADKSGQDNNNIDEVINNKENINQKEGIDEEDRKPRKLGGVRKKLAVDEIRRLSYQKHENFIDDVDEEDTENKEKRKEAPWWATESCPPVIQNQKQGMFSTLKSGCLIM